MTKNTEGRVQGAVPQNSSPAHTASSGDYHFGLDELPNERWPVAWYNPMVLMRSAREMLSSFDMIRNADPREKFGETITPIEFPADAEGGFGFDFVSDVGDGGNATYTVARAALQPRLQAGNDALKRGELLVLGGDLAYPGASSVEYQYRFLEPYEGARSQAGMEPAKAVLAVAQNHDWFDSTATFRRYFVDRNCGEVIGARTPQKSTYFAAKLPHGWWLLGFDFALTHDIDRGQLNGFRALLPARQPDGTFANSPAGIQAGDSVILIYPEPYWTRPLGDRAADCYPKRYQRLEAEILDSGVDIRLRLAGDLHHYVHEFQEADPSNPDDLPFEAITCGSGGAFLHPTHAREVSRRKICRRADNAGALTPELRRSVQLGTDGKPWGKPDARRVTYPSAGRSRGLSLLNLFALFKGGANGLPRSWPDLWRGNILFAITLGVLYWLAAYTNSLAFSKAFAVDGFVATQDVHAESLRHIGWLWFRALFFSPLALGVHLVLCALCIAIAKEADGLIVKGLIPILHFIAHVAATATLFWLIARLVHAWSPTLFSGCTSAECLSLWSAILRGTLQAVAGVFVGGLIFGSYFALMALSGFLMNNAFSALAIEDYKGFLRFRIDAGGDLHGRFLGCDKVPRRWKPNVAAAGTIAGDVRPAWVEAGEAAKWRVVENFHMPKLRPAPP